ncbi:hypothetical protein [Pseudomonas sp. S1(2024)]|uniref:hypothetical protein n=1 Tax=Pseudomonas sp. S1(2024) TaxID=3390191 RepID=UPI003978408E
MNKNYNDVPSHTHWHSRRNRYQYLMNLRFQAPLSVLDEAELQALHHQLHNESTAMLSGFIALAGISLIGGTPLQAVLVGGAVALVSWALNRKPCSLT